MKCCNGLGSINWLIMSCFVEHMLCSLCVQRMFVWFSLPITIIMKYSTTDRGGLMWFDD